MVELKQKNQQTQDTIQKQINTLMTKLDELKTEHIFNESSSENVIASLTDKLVEVSDFL